MKQKRRNFRQWREEHPSFNLWWQRVLAISGHPLFGLTVALLTLLAGLFATFWTEDIQSTWLLRAHHWSDVDWRATWFWIVVGLWFVLFLCHQLAESEASFALQRNAELTAEAVLALPSKTFFDYFSAHICNHRVLKPTSDHAGLEETVQTLLQAVANLAHVYDFRPNARYAANVMIYIPKHPVTKTNLKPFDKFTNDEKYRFLPDFDDTKLQGLLYLPEKLSAVDEAGYIDPDVEPEFVFPVPEIYIDGNTWKSVLPGAPLTYLKWNLRIARPAYVRDAARRLRKKADEAARALKEGASHSATETPAEKLTANQAATELAKKASQLRKEASDLEKIAEQLVKPPSHAVELRNAAHGADDILALKNYRIKEELDCTYEIEGERIELGDMAVKALIQYYPSTGRGRRVRSFQAFPLVLPGTSYEAIGTVNIHCDSPTFLGAPAGDASRRRSAFGSAISPIIFDIAKTVDDWVKSIP